MAERFTDKSADKFHNAALSVLIDSMQGRYSQIMQILAAFSDLTAVTTAAAEAIGVIMCHVIASELFLEKLVERRRAIEIAEAGEVVDKLLDKSEKRE